MQTLTITIPGKPISKKRPRFFRRGNHVGAYNSQETEEGKFMKMLSMHLPSEWELIESPISLNVSFGLPIPKSISKDKQIKILSGEIKHTKKPDLDNLQKFVKDCANGILWRDDSQVFETLARKSYSEKAETIISIIW